MLPRVLLVEDDRTVREAVTLVLGGAGFDVVAVGDGPAALAELRAEPPPEVMVLDIMLPGMSGLDVCREVRASSGLPIVMLTARADTGDIVTGLELGADDYVTKPFAPAELAARVRSVFRRSTANLSPAASDQPTTAPLRIRDLTIDEDAFSASSDGDALTLTSMEFRLLTTLARHAGTVMTRDVLLDRVWGYDYLGDSRLVDMAVLRLREKLGAPPEPPEYIATVRGVGYRFERG